MQAVLGNTGGSTINKAAYLDAMEKAGNLSFSIASKYAALFIVEPPVFQL